MYAVVTRAMTEKPNTEFQGQQSRDMDPQMVSRRRNLRNNCKTWQIKLIDKVKSSQTMIFPLFLIAFRALVKIPPKWMISLDSVMSGEEPLISHPPDQASQSCSKEVLTQTISSKVCLVIATLSLHSPPLLSGLIE